MTTITKENIESELKAGRRWIVVKMPDGRYRDISQRMLAKMSGEYEAEETQNEIIVHFKE